MHRVFTEMVF